jgi:hypothetical protein
VSIDPKKPWKEHTGYNVEHIAMIDRRINFGGLFMFQGLQYTHRRTVDVTRYKGNSNSLLLGNHLQLFNQPISFFLLAIKGSDKKIADKMTDSKTL